MVIKATLKRVKIAEVSITLHPDGRSRPPHLRPWRDGWRHLRFMLVYSPRWLFLMPGLIIAALGLIATLFLYSAPREIFGVAFDVGTMLLSSMAIVVGIQLVGFACFTKVFAISEGLLPPDKRFARIFRFLSLERGVAAGGLLLVLGFSLLARAIWIWKEANFGELTFSANLHLLAPATTAIIVGVQNDFLKLLHERARPAHYAAPSAGGGRLIQDDE